MEGANERLKLFALYFQMLPFYGNSRRNRTIVSIVFVQPYATQRSPEWTMDYRPIFYGDVLVSLLDFKHGFVVCT